MRRERHDVIAHAGQISAPVLMVHGEDDTGIPQEWAQMLFSALPGTKRFILYPQGTHTNLMDQGLADDILTFVADPKR
jgi:fermentation-respiration switch protein FrsA (DUF1100 family)